MGELRVYRIHTPTFIFICIFIYIKTQYNLLKLNCYFLFSSHRVDTYSTNKNKITLIDLKTSKYLKLNLK